MNREQILGTLRQHEMDLRHLGVAHAALFGSLARNEGHAASDIDLMVEINPEASIGVFEYVGIVQYLEELFPLPVDVANKEMLKPLIRPSAEHDAIYAF